MIVRHILGAARREPVALNVATANLRSVEARILRLLPLPETLLRAVLAVGNEVDQALARLERRGDIARRSCGLTGRVIIVDRRPTERTTYQTRGSGARIA